MFEDILSQLGGMATDIYWVEARDAANHPTMPRTAPHNVRSNQNANMLRLGNPDLCGAACLGVYALIFLVGPTGSFM